MKRFITVVLLFAAKNSFAQSDTIKARKAKSMINKEVVVKTEIAGLAAVGTNGKNNKRCPAKFTGNRLLSVQFKIY